ncbi:unnamed protein product, partial [Prunus brigantina]
NCYSTWSSEDHRHYRFNTREKQTYDPLPDLEYSRAAIQFKFIRTAARLYALNIFKYNSTAARLYSLNIFKYYHTNVKLPTHILVTVERNKESRTVTYVVEPGDMENDIAMVRHAYHFYKIFRACLSRAFFHNRKAEVAFRLIAIELNFVYEALFTKAVVVHSTRGCIFRAISFTAVSVA